MSHIEEVSQKLLEKSEELFAALKLYEGNYQGNHAMLTKLKCLSNKIEHLDGLMKRNRMHIERYTEQTIESQDLQNEITLSEEHLSHLIDNIPDTAPQNTSMQSNSNNCFDSNPMSLNSYINSTASSVVSPIPDSWKDLKSPSPCIRNQANGFNVLKDQTNYIGHQVEKPKTLPSNPVPVKSSIPTIMPFCENELKQVPAYLKGRLTCAQINEIIDAMNSVLKIKYSMIKKKFSQIKNADKEIYAKWKEQDRQAIRGQYFITQSDLTAYGHIQMSKSNMNILTILSNARKVKKEHMKNNVKYIVVPN
uniref:SKA complex subunit 1 n=1 Tax=Cacopsylla melanoneura TaxID=428564 RepID=A0A8D8TCB2_9HEMI